MQPARQHDPCDVDADEREHQVGRGFVDFLDPFAAHVVERGPACCGDDGRQAQQPDDG